MSSNASIHLSLASKISTTGSNPSSSPASHIPPFTKNLSKALVLAEDRQVRYSTWDAAKVGTCPSGRKQKSESISALVGLGIVSIYATNSSLDIASISIEQARQRWESQRSARFSATFAALDCYTQPLSQAFSLDLLRQPFDVVSMQFCMHYAFETEQKARCMLDNVSRWLRRGGVFIGTIPNAEQLL